MGYGFTRVTTVLCHAPWTKEKEDENVQARAQSSGRSPILVLYIQISRRKGNKVLWIPIHIWATYDEQKAQMLSMRISFPFIHHFMPSKKWRLVFSETNSFHQCVYLVQHCLSNAMANVLYWHYKLIRCYNPALLVSFVILVLVIRDIRSGALELVT